MVSETNFQYHLMKKFRPLFLFAFLSIYSWAQNPVDLRGVRYYYETPTFGVFGTANNGFEPLHIAETNDSYLLSGNNKDGLMIRNTVIKINKASSTLTWDYFEDKKSQTRGISLTPDDKVLMAFDNYQDDSIKFARINTDGSANSVAFLPFPYVRIENFNRVATNLNAANGIKGIDTILAATLFFNDNGQLQNTVTFPNPSPILNLPISTCTSLKTLAFNNDMLTFGTISRQLSTAGTTPAGFAPVLWHWAGQTIFTSKEIYSELINQNTGYSDIKLIDVQKFNNDFILAVKQRSSSAEVNYVPHLTYLDANLNIVWDVAITNLSDVWTYKVAQLKVDENSGIIYLAGYQYRYTPSDQRQFVARYQADGTLIDIKFFTIDENIENNIYAMELMENGDLLFVGKGKQADGTRYFFTYRTNPEGYHSDGQYVGLHEFLVSATEIGVFPNPSDGIFQVSSISTEPMQISILDEQGKQVAQFDLDELSSDHLFDLSDQAPGVYFAHISQGEQQWVKKLVVR
ncbi:MAG: Secretion system C-terminal sorting domain [Bacteroidota bacterium]